MRKLLLILFALVFCLVSCNPNGTMYYATKWIWNKKLKKPVTVKMDINTNARTEKVGEGPFEYINVLSDEEFKNTFVQKLYEEFSCHDMITMVPADADYFLNITSIIIKETVTSEWGGDELFHLSACRVDICFDLLNSEGQILDSDAVKAEESETLHEGERTDGTMVYRVKSRSIDFENLLARAADKILAYSTNDMARDK